MTVPDYQSVMLPLLKFAAEKKDETSTGEVVEVLTKVFRLTEEDLKELLPSGIQSTFVNRVGWAATYMKKAGLLEATRRGYYRITHKRKDGKTTLLEGRTLCSSLVRYRRRRLTRAYSLLLPDLPTKLEAMFLKSGAKLF